MGREVLSSAMDVLNDVTEGGRTLEDAIFDRGAKGLKNLKRKAVVKMRGGGGSGIKSVALNKTPQSKRISRARKSSSRKKGTASKKTTTKAKNSCIKNRKKKNTKKATTKRKTKAILDSIHQYF